MAGSRGNREIPQRLPELLFEDTAHGRYDDLVDTLASTFDWAVFTYFTTFHGGVYAFLGREPVLAEACKSTFPNILFEGDAEQGKVHARLPNASLDDADIPGAYAMEWARSQGEGDPYLLCGILQSDPGIYRSWNDLNERRDDKNWYEGLLASFPVVEDFSCRIPNGTDMRYLVLRCTNMDAYDALWAQSHRNNSIARFTMSADTDLAALRRILQSTDALDVTDRRNEVGSWSYGLVYGGGPDEFHGLFHSVDGTATDWIWNACGDARISRF